VDTNKATLRFIDANLNRSSEGLRVAEDVVRFFLNDRKLQGSFKAMRHGLKKLNKAIALKCDVLLSRNVRTDVGKKTKREDMRRKGFDDVLLANTQRVKESLRSLEEITKLLDPLWSDGFKRLRFKLYTAEKEAVKKIRKAENK